MTRVQTQAAVALKRLREHPDDKQAADALEQAVRWLQEQSNSKSENGEALKAMR
jgi:hypothetical protein